LRLSFEAQQKQAFEVVLRLQGIAFQVDGLITFSGLKSFQSAFEV
jgi:hypothetical protein